MRRSGDMIKFVRALAHDARIGHRDENLAAHRVLTSTA
jgi:hypothetical protein